VGIEDRLRRIEGEPNCGRCPYDAPPLRLEAVRIIDADGQELGFIKDPNDPGDALPELCARCPHADVPRHARPPLIFEIVCTARYDELREARGVKQQERARAPVRRVRCIIT
jgi:hypothetical protein